MPKSRVSKATKEEAKLVEISTVVATLVTTLVTVFTNVISKIITGLIPATLGGVTIAGMVITVPDVPSLNIFGYQVSVLIPIVFLVVLVTAYAVLRGL